MSNGRFYRYAVNGPMDRVSMRGIGDSVREIFSKKAGENGE